MKKHGILFKTFPFLFMAFVATGGCTPSDKSDVTFDPLKVELDGNRMTPENLWRLAKVGNAQVSPDGRNIAFTVATTDIAEDKTYAEIYLLPVEGGTPFRLTYTRENEYEIAWLPDGSAITYLATRGKDPQVWAINPDGTNARQMTDIEGGVDAYRISPDGTRMLVVKRIKLDQTVNDIHPDLPKANARIETSLMYRHWNAWSDFSYNHILVVDLDNGRQKGSATDIMEGERYHSPLMPFGGIEQICWTPDGEGIAYTCKKKEGKESALSTNSDIYLYNIKSRQTRNLTEGNMGYDTNPSFSPDGLTMFYQSMEHDGYESDKNRLMMLDMASGQRTDLSEGTENNIDAYCLSDDARSVWVISDSEAKDAIFCIDIASRQIRKVTNDVCDYTSVADAGSCLIASRMSMMAPSEIYAVDKQSGQSRCLSNVNADALAKLEMGTVEERWIATTDGKQMLTWVIYPPHFDKTRQYPALLYCQGGPQSTVSQFWSTRWNFALMAANDYIVVAPNRRGLPGFGREWNEQISGDYGGQNMKDYLSAIDEVSREPFVDENRLGAVGASYGGFSVYWLAGNHEKRFKAFIAHCGIFNFDQLYATTEELFFVNWDLKGAFWEKNNVAAMKSYSNSPHLFVNNWDTPIMVIHGEKDFRIPYTQGMAAFNTAVMKDVPAQFLYFPEECHWVLKPQNSILWHREFYKWLDKWLK